MNDQEKRELLVRLAENVMGGELIGNGSQNTESSYCFVYRLKNRQTLGFWTGDWGYTESEWNPLENIADAWMLVEALKPKAMLTLYDSGSKWWRARFDGHNGEYMTLEKWQAESISAPLAICLAADKATRGAK